MLGFRPICSAPLADDWRVFVFRPAHAVVAARGGASSTRSVYTSGTAVVLSRGVVVSLQSFARVGDQRPADGSAVAGTRPGVIVVIPGHRQPAQREAVGGRPAVESMQPLPRAGQPAAGAAARAGAATPVPASRSAAGSGIEQRPAGPATVPQPRSASGRPA